MTLWDWASAAYARPEVAKAALALQDDHGQSISFLLWAAWARPDAAAAGKGAELARALSQAAISPLREARRALKQALPPMTDDEREALRDQVRAAELAAEKVLLATLERISGARIPGPGAGPATPSLLIASAAWGPAAPVADLAAFADALG